MRILDLIEARKNPEQNPKTPINKIIIKAVNAAPGEIAGTKNVFVSFTSVDKLGINPKSKYDTPIGIYAYPAEYVQRVTGSTKRMSDLPFAGESEYANIFNASGNIINVATITAPEVREYYKKIAELWAKISGTDWKTSVDHIERYINNAGTKAKFPDYPGGQLWYVTMMASREFFSSAWKTKTPIAWNKLFRSIGIDGVIDYTPAGGQGIIHTSEPTQAVFFTINNVKNVKRYNNNYSPAQTVRQQEYGAEKHSEVANAAALLNKSKNAQDVYANLERWGFEYFRLVKDKNIRKELLSKNPQLIGRLPHPTPEEQLLVLKIDPATFGYVHNPDEQVVLTVLKTVEGATAAISPESIVRKLPYAGLDLQEFVVENDVYQFQYFKHPHPKAIKLALDLLSQHNLVTPKWLAKIARAYKVPFQRIESDMIKDTRRNIEVLKNDVIQLQQRIKKLQDEWAVTEKELKASGEIKSIPTLKVYYDKDIAKLQSQLENTQQRIKRDLAWIEKELNSN